MPAQLLLEPGDHLVARRGLTDLDQQLAVEAARDGQGGDQVRVAVAWLVESAGQRLFVKTAWIPGPPVPGAPVPFVDHPGRVRRLRNAVHVARSSDHPSLPALLNVIESLVGPALVYEAAAGDLIRTLIDAHVALAVADRPPRERHRHGRRLGQSARPVT